MGVCEKMDISEGRESDLCQRIKYESYSENSDCFFEYDIESDTITFTQNKTFLEWSGLTIKNCTEECTKLGLVHQDDQDDFCKFLNAGNQRILEFRYRKEDGIYIWCLAKSAVIKGEDGKPNTVLGIINDINQQNEENFLKSNEEMIDPLTQLYSRKSAEEFIKEYLQKDGKLGKHALLIVDVKGFQNINKRLGHVFGDGVLSNIAQAIKWTFQKSDIIARIGGDDFLIFIKNMDNIEMLQEKVALLQKLFENTYAGELHEIKISCNIGIATYPKDGSLFENLFKNADSALFAAKQKEEGNCAFYDPFSMEIKNVEKDQYYHSYEIERRKIYTNGNFFREITNFALHIMSETKDVGSAIKLLLDKVGKYYQCEHVYILERNKENKLIPSYWWHKDGGLGSSKHFIEIDLNESVGMEDAHFDEDGIFKVDNTALYDGEEKIKKIIALMEAKAVLQCAFYEEGIYKGCVCIGDSEAVHYWKQEEIGTLITITKIISFYLLKLKVSEKMKEKMDMIENFDGLTGLPTLYKFKMQVNEILRQYPERDFAVLYLDFNKFKYINDTLGYKEGDRLLQEFSKVLMEENWGIVSAARVSADNFIVLMPYVNDDIIKNIIQKLNTRFQFKVKGSSIGSSVYIVSGACVVRRDRDIMDSIDNANVARKYAKSASKTVCRFYDSKMEERIKLELDICNSMEQALKDEEFLVYLQPKVGLKDSRIVGAEALTRWRRSNHIMMPPNSFIPLFERNGFIVKLDFYVYRKVCEMLRKWLDRGGPVVPISVNVSRVHMNYDDFVKRVQDLVASYRIPAKLLEFELTESIFLDSTEVALSTMKELRNLGFGVSIDDFGAGFSSLNLLKDMTTDVLKLDKEFLRDGEMKKEEKIIVSSIINMAKQLSMKVLSEGVETEMQSEFLKNISCDMAQGYLFAKPMPIEQFEVLLQKEKHYTNETLLWVSGED